MPSRAISGKHEHGTPVIPTGRSEIIRAEKRILRKKVIAERLLLSEGDWLQKSREIADAVQRIPEFPLFRHVLGYLPLADRREVDTSELFALLIRQGKELSIPVTAGCELVTAAYRNGEPVRTGEFGQCEPLAPVMSDERTLDAVLVPVVAADLRGYRLGYGKGFYDRFFSRLSAAGCHPLRIGLAFYLQVLPKIPVDPWDQPLDYIVHEQGVFQYNNCH
ncbi:MAG: 5-formyltetrahydrofolate cyclo-ligase [Chlorobiaceae bacterium]|nr:5-formyltetrahydrofolate cyclo-ligase [Chlorobiaceae bacterium]NTW62997.1 5-formyltetrahydrofolate cyclo-ligase [Chlorobiaceae bacterium]